MAQAYVAMDGACLLTVIIAEATITVWVCQITIQSYAILHIRLIEGCENDRGKTITCTLKGLFAQIKEIINIVDIVNLHSAHTRLLWDSLDNWIDAVIRYTMADEDELVHRCVVYSSLEISEWRRCQGNSIVAGVNVRRASSKVDQEAEY